MSVSIYPELNNREEELLQYIIQNFIVSANPVASKTLVEKHKLNISPATARNTMNSLETKGLLDHPHTSSGRVPTDLGYRYYVDSLMQVSRLTDLEQQTLDQINEFIRNDLSDAVKGAAKTLARLSNLLAIVIAPKLSSGIFRKMELVGLGNNRLLVIITIESGLVKTITVEVQSSLEDTDLHQVSALMNERLSGLTLKEISAKMGEIVADDYSTDRSGLIRVFIDSADLIFEDHQHKNFHFGGVEYMAMQPEFNDLSSYKGIIEFVENEDLIIHILEGNQRSGDSGTKALDVSVRIGSEHKVQQISTCSVVSANYMIGKATGTIGLVGPTRMNYPRMVALVEQLANRFTKNNYYE